LFQTSEKPLTDFDEDYLRSFLQTLRQFTLKRESVNFNQICDLINENCGRSEIQDWVMYAKKFWKDTLASAPLAIQSHGVDYNVETALDLFWYGGQAHSDPDKDRQIEELDADIQGALKMLLFMSFHRLRHALILVNSLIVMWLDKPDDPVTPSNKSADSSQEGSG
jgi:hypothetical protein